MLRIAICDDESYFAEELKELLSGYMMEKGLVFEIDTYNSGEELVGLGIKVIQYKVVFLDINMEKVDGITAAEKIRRISKEVFIVFVTAYMDYSLEGYRLDVVRYLLKGDANFRATVNECMDAIINKLNYSIRKKEFRFIATLACKAAVKGRMKLDTKEQIALIDQMVKLNNPFTCPHGRPTAYEISKYEIERRFLRK